MLKLSSDALPQHLDALVAMVTATQSSTAPAVPCYLHAIMLDLSGHELTACNQVALLQRGPRSLKQHWKLRCLVLAACTLGPGTSLPDEHVHCVCQLRSSA